MTENEVCQADGKRDSEQDLRTWHGVSKPTPALENGSAASH